MEKETIKNKIQKLINHYHNKNFKYVVDEGQILLKKIPKNIFLINLISLSFQGAGNLKMAANGFVEIINLDNQNKEAYNNLGTVFRATGDYEDAKKNFEKSLKIDPNFVSAITNLGNLYFELNDYEAAIRTLEKAVNIDEKNVLGHYNLGLVYQSLGENDKSINQFTKVLEINPINTNADKLISRMTKYTKDNAHLKNMEKKLVNLKLNDFQKIPLYFSIGKAYEDIKDYDESFKFIKLANDNKKKLLNYNLKNEIKTFNNLKTYFKSFNFQKQKETCHKKIIFIVGLPRSGTSLIEQIISSHSKVYGCGELSYVNTLVEKNFLTNNILDIKKLQNLTELQVNKIANNYFNLIEKFDKDSEIYTDKAPLNFIWLGIIKLLFPNSKIIHCVRNPKDNILSLYKNDFDGKLNFTYNFEDLFEFYNEYYELINFWKEQFTDQIFDADYEKIIGNPDKQIKELLNYCDLEFEEKCLKFYETRRPIKTVSSNQARKPLYDSSISSFKNYEKFMKSIFSKIDNLE
tara:strand:- start:691 stop:2247 length:1557 start_codon:yes stop_codon:yes gene_type:complete